MGLSKENIKIAVSFRAARAAIGWTQIELAQKLEIAKTTLARIETLEMYPKADLVARALRIFRDAGVFIEPFYDDHITLKVEPKALEEVKYRLEDTTMRRSDRKKGKASTLKQEKK